MLSVDFVSQAADGVVQFGASALPSNMRNATTTSFAFLEIGNMHQGLMAFDATPGASGFYRVCSGGECSTVFHVVPNVAAGEERFAVFGDFGLTNDVSMSDLIAEAAKGSYDSVLHVGDWAYDFDKLGSIVGNAFMDLAQGYMAVKPVVVAEGNHEACGACLQNVPEIPFSANNFTQYGEALLSSLARACARARASRRSPTHLLRTIPFAGTRAASTRSRSTATRATTATTLSTAASPTSSSSRPSHSSTPSATSSTTTWSPS